MLAVPSWCHKIPDQGTWLGSTNFWEWDIPVCHRVREGAIGTIPAMFQWSVVHHFTDWPMW